MTPPSSPSPAARDVYFPPPESDGGWRFLGTPDEVRSVGGFDPDRLHLACEFNAQFAHTSSVAGDPRQRVIRHGWLVAEWLEISALTTTRYDVWSATKSFTGTAYGLLFEDSRQGRLPNGLQIDLDTPAYDHIPEGHPLTDPRKARITLRHLLTMTSGIPGESTGCPLGDRRRPYGDRRRPVRGRPRLHLVGQHVRHPLAGPPA